MDSSLLDTDPVKTIKSILGYQQDLIADKAAELIANGSAEEKARVVEAKEHIK